MRRALFIIGLLIFIQHKIFAQDPVFTQFYASPILMNPAFAGSEGNTRIGLGYRNQWTGMNQNLSTYYAAADNFLENINSGLGFSVINQKEELTNYNFLQANAAYSLHLQLSENWSFFPGISFGVGLKSFNFRGLLLEDQINLYNGNLPQSEDPFVENDNITFFDVSVGGVLYGKKAWLGFSLRHLTKPNISFVANENMPLNMYLSIHGGYTISLNSDYTSLTNSENSLLFLTFNYMKQDQFNRLDLGVEFEVSRFYFGILAATVIEKIPDNTETLLSINPLAGIEFRKMKIGFSYDFPISNIGSNAGTTEITLQYYIRKTKERKRRWQVKN